MFVEVKCKFHFWQKAAEVEHTDVGCHITEDEALEAWSLQDSSVGGVSDSGLSQNAAAHFAGYISMKINKFHIKTMNQSVAECKNCSFILDDPNYNLHMFTSFKDYGSSSFSCLTYCSPAFVKLVQDYERLFLYCFENYSTVEGFANFT